MRFVDSSRRAPPGPAHRPDDRSATWWPATASSCRCIRPARRASTSPGVRYRAWQPPSALHPTIGVDVPSCSTWSTPGTAVPGRMHLPCRPSRRPQLHQMPVNSYEAESRRLARFLPFGHTPGQSSPLPRARASPEFRYTVDLRTCSEDKGRAGHDPARTALPPNAVRSPHLPLAPTTPCPGTPGRGPL